MESGYQTNTPKHKLNAISADLNKVTPGIDTSQSKLKISFKGLVH
jgi:hypothetical protein